MSEQVYSLTQPDELELTEEQEAKWIQEHLEKPTHLILLAVVEDEIVGSLDFACGHRRRIAHTGEFGMSVAQNWRERGIGSMLLKSLLHWAEATPGIEKINLLVHATNERAIALYRKFDFNEEGRRRNDLKYGPGNYVDAVLMGRFVK